MPPLPLTGMTRISPLMIRRSCAILFPTAPFGARYRSVAEHRSRGDLIMWKQLNYFQSVVRIPLTRSNDPIRQNYCAFWKRDNTNGYAEEFARLLKARFAK